MVLSRMNQGQALGMLAISGIQIGAMLDLAQLSEHVLAKRPYLGDPEDGDCRAYKKLITLVETVKDHLWHADNQMNGEHAKRGGKDYKKDFCETCGTMTQTF